MKKSIFVIITLVALLSVNYVKALENSAYYEQIAYEGIDYDLGEGVKSRQMGTFDANGGSGWASPWSGSNTDFTVMPKADGEVPNIILNKDWNMATRQSVFNYRKDAPLYRKLAKNFDFSKDGEYYIGVSFCPSPFNDTYKKVADVRFKIGSNDFYFGYKYDDAGNIVPQIYVGGQLVLADNSLASYVYTDKVYYRCILNIKVDADGEDEVKLKMFEERNTEPIEWNNICNTNLDGERQYIGVVVSTTGEYPVFFDNINIERFDATILSLVNDVINKINNSEAVNKEECATAIEKLSYLPNNSIRNDKLNVVMNYAQENGWKEELSITKFVLAIPENNQKVHPDDTDKIQLEFNYALDASKGIIALEKGGVPVEAISEIVGKTVYITPANTLDKKSTYTVDATGLTDFKGDLAEEFSYTFSTGFGASVNVIDDGEYGQYKQITWQDIEGVNSVATVSYNSGVATPIQNNGKLLQIGDCTLTITSANTASNEVETRILTFTVLEAYAPTAKNVIITGNAQPGAAITGNYTFEDLNNEAEKVSKFKWLSSDSEDGEYSEVKGATEKSYTITENDINKYFIFEVIPCSDSEFLSEGAAAASTPFAGPFAPLALNPKITGIVKLNENLTAYFEYFDKNGDVKGLHKYQWYASDTENGALAKLEGETGCTFKITEAVFEKYIAFCIIPVSSKAPLEGLPVYSERILAPSKPYVANVRIEGSAKVGSALSGYYSFFDNNGDGEVKSILLWKDINTNDVLGSGSTLKLTEDMSGSKIVFVVTGVSTAEPSCSELVQSESVTVCKKESSGGGGFAYSGSQSGSKTSQLEVPIVTAPAQQPNTNEVIFKDTQGHWAKDYIEKLARDKVLNGIDDNSFAPEQKVTRGEFISMIIRAKDAETTKYQSIYSDVNSNDWYCDYIQTAYNLNLISSDERFRPNDSITREEAAKMLSIVCNAQIDEEFNLNYQDNEEISQWAAKYVNAVTQSAIMQGSDNKFRPLGELTRAEAAKVICNIRIRGE